MAAETRHAAYKISVNSLRVLARTMNVFCKLNDSVYIELLVDGIRLDTVSDARSVYATVRLQRSFFQAIEVGNGPSQLPADGSLTNSRMLRLTTRLVLSVLRTLPLASGSQQKASVAAQREAEANQLEAFALRHDARRCRIIFEAHFAHGLVRRHSLAYAESDRLTAAFRSSAHQCMIRCAPRTLFDALGSFSSKQEDILACFDERNNRLVLLFKTYIDDTDEHHPHVFSEAQVDEDLLDECRLKKLPVNRRNMDASDADDTTVRGAETDTDAEMRYPELVFNLREFRAMLTLLEASGSTIRIPVTLLFETGGKPLILEYTGSDEYQASFALATSALPTHRRAAHGRAGAQDATNRTMRLSDTNNATANDVSRPILQAPRDQRKTNEADPSTCRKRTAAERDAQEREAQRDVDLKAAQVESLARSQHSENANGAPRDAHEDVEMNAFLSQAIGPPPAAPDATAPVTHSRAQRRFLRELSKVSVSMSRTATSHDSMVYDSDENEQDEAAQDDAEEIGW